MKYILISIITITVILVLYIQYIKRNENKQTIQNTNDLETKDNNTNQEKTDIEILKKIKSEEYIRYILTKKTTKSYISNSIQEYGELYEDQKYKLSDFKIAEYKDWKIIKLDESISFYVYHNLVGWLTGYDEDSDIPELSIGFSKNKTNHQEDYLFFLDPKNNFGDTHIGTFKNGDLFSIFLPDAYEEYGNLTIKNGFQSLVKDYIDNITEQGFSTSGIDSLKYNAL